MIKTDKIVRPIVHDLIELDIREYLITNRFERLCIERCYIDEWEEYLEKCRNYLELGRYTVMEAAFAMLINQSFKSESGCQFLSNVIKDFIKWRNSPLDFKEFKRSLNIYFDNHYLLLLEEFYEEFSLNLDKPSSSSKEVEIIISKHKEETLLNNSLIQNWKKSISKAEIEKVVDEIIEYGVDNENDIIALSSRWHSLKSKYHQGVIKEDEFNIENNKIVHSLLDFIKNMKNTEGI